MDATSRSSEDERQHEMTYKEYYLTLKSPEDIKIMANADMTYAAIVSPERIKIIIRSAEEAIKEKFDIVEDIRGE